MKPHQQRVIQEHAELEARTNKLREFLMFNSSKHNIDLSAHELRMLWMQLNAMEVYQSVLEQRIENFPVEPST